MLDIDGEIPLRTQRPPVQIIEEDDYFDVSGIYAIRISAENYEKCIDTVISSAYVSTPGPGGIAHEFKHSTNLCLARPSYSFFGHL